MGSGGTGGWGVQVQSNMSLRYCLRQLYMPEGHACEEPQESLGLQASLYPGSPFEEAAFESHGFSPDPRLKL